MRPASPLYSELVILQGKGAAANPMTNWNVSEHLHRQLRDAYKRARGTEPDPLMSSSALLEVIARRAPDLIRGSATRLLGVAGRGRIWRASDVNIISKHNLYLGDGVSLSSGVVINAFSLNGVRIERRSTIGRNTSLLASGTIARIGTGIAIGANTSIGELNLIWGQGGVTIGDNVLFGPSVIAVSANHGFRNLEMPIRSQKEEYSPIVVGNDCWIGAHVVILAGSSIGDGSVIAAGSVVRGQIPSLSIAAGSPARVIARRDDTL